MSKLDNFKDKIKSSDREDETELVAYFNMVKIVNITKILKEQYDMLSFFSFLYLVNY